MNFNPGDCVLVHCPETDVHGKTGIVLRAGTTVHVYLHGLSTRVLHAYPINPENLIKMNWVPA